MCVKKITLILSLICWGSLAHAGEITAYTSLEPSELGAYVAAAEHDLPGLKVNIVRLSTGDLGARLIAESAQPKADVIWGWAVTDMLNPRILAQLGKYSSPAVQQVPDKFRGSDGKWFAPTGYMAAFCVNTRRLKQKKLSMPESWSDLTKQEFHNELVMPNPVSSGTGYLQVVSILQGMGDENGWKLLRALNTNVAQYSKSGSRPCSMVSMGEYAVGASSAIAASEAIRQGYPIKMVIPKEGAGYELEANAMLASSSHQADARRFLNWTLSPAATQLYYKYKAIVWQKLVGEHDNTPLTAVTRHQDSLLFDMDFIKSSQSRNTTIDQWRKRIEFGNQHAGAGSH